MYIVGTVTSVNRSCSLLHIMLTFILLLFCGCTLINGRFVDSVLHLNISANNRTREYNSTTSQTLTLDIIDKFLLDLETYNEDNCEPGTGTQLGPGVVQQYGKKRFRSQADLTVDRANLLTGIWKLNNTQLHVDEIFFYNQVVNLARSDADIFAAGNCYNYREFNNYDLFCPYAYKTNDSILVKDLSVEYPYLKYDWFMDAISSAKSMLANRTLTFSQRKLRHKMSNGTVVHLEPEGDWTLLSTYEDGVWTTPYFDCGGGNIWMMTYIVPFFGLHNGTFKFKGTSGIDIALQKVDIDQCDLEPGSTDTNIFANSSKCQPTTTKCVAVRNMGFRRGSYKCICKPGFYFPDFDLPVEERYFNGSYAEYQYDLKSRGLDNQYDGLHCLPCKEGCDVCEDDRPCIRDINWTMRNYVLVATCLVMSVIPVIAFLVWKYQEEMILKAASPKLLGFVLGGAFLLYCPMIAMYFKASVLTCSMKVWFRELGFTISYGALLLKTWRIGEVFRVVTANQVKISDTGLIKRLSILVALAIVFLIIRMIWGRPHVEEGRHKDGLKVYQCSFDPWDYCQAAVEFALLLWGVKLCIGVRKAPSEFNESQFISWAIYNETLLAFFLNFTLVLLQYIDFASPDVLYIVNFIYINFTTTVMLVFLFTTKAYLMYKEKKNPKARRGSSRRSNSQFKHSKYVSASPAVNSSTDKDEELRRVYEELSELKQQLMKENNPHLTQNGRHHKTRADNSPEGDNLCTQTTEGNNNIQSKATTNDLNSSKEHESLLNNNDTKMVKQQRVVLCLDDMTNITAV